MGGTGLGLAISQRIIEMMGGQFTVTSEPGKSSTFAFTFRAAAGKDNIDSLLDPSVNWKNVRIMVIDDDTGVLTYFQEMFKLRGITCDIAVTGEEALKRTEASSIYGIYFVDWGIPGINGIGFTRTVKAFREEHRRKSVVIMISASDWGLICDDAKEAGVDKYLMKPEALPTHFQ